MNWLRKTFGALAALVLVSGSALAFTAGDFASYEDTTGSKIVDSGVGSANLTAVVATKAALGALSTATVPSGIVIRQDYSAGFGAAPATYVASTGACTYPDGGQQIASADGKCWLLKAGARWDVRQWGVNYPLTMYMIPTGNDHAGLNTCLLVADPCATLAQAQVSMGKFDFNGSNPTWNFLAGGGYFTTGIILGGTDTRGAILTLNGVNSGSTGIFNAALADAIRIAGGANIVVQNMALQTSGGGSDLWAAQYSRAEVGLGMLFGDAAIARIFAQDESMINIDGPLAISGGNSVYAFLATDVSDIRGFGPTLVTFTGSPIIANLMDVANNSHIKLGGFTYTGAASITQAFVAAQDSSFDTEGVYGQPGGNGSVSGNSTMPGGTDVGWCFGSGGGCALLNAPTGLGAGAAVSFVSTSDYGSKVTLTAGTGAAANIVMFVKPYSVIALCAGNMNPGGSGAWSPRATIQTSYGSFSGANGIEIVADNNGVAFNPGSSYIMNIVCH